jgi:glycosyltransferase involved in cell wall biosynthesis
MNPIVSVIIPCYNQAEYLAEAVESVIHQTYTNWEILIINDGSKDNTSDVARKLIERYITARISIIEKVRNEGLARARNTGIENSGGKYLLPLDADDKIHTTFLEKTVALLENNPDISIVYTDLLQFGEASEIVRASEYDFQLLKFNNQLNYCSLFRKEAWTTVGGYNPNMVVGYEDWDFWISCGAKGFYAKRIPESLFLYRVKKSSMFTNALKFHEKLRAGIILNHPNLYDENTLLNAKRLLKRQFDNGIKSNPLVSVIVPTYNRPEMLKIALESLNCQTMNDFEIIVINDGGADVRNVIDGLNERDNIVYLQHSTNRGLPAARNTGIRVARGKYIAYLDADDIYYPDHLQILVDFLETAPFKIAYTDAYRSIYKKIDGKILFRDKERYASLDFDRDRIFVENYIPVLCFMHAKSCFDEVGTFDETLTSHEDWDLWIRMSMKFEIGHIQKITCEFSWIDNDVRESERRTEFLSTLLIIYEKYKNVIIQKPELLEAQKNKFTQSLQWAYNHIKGLETEKRNFQENLKQLNKTVQSIQAKLTAIQDNLSWRILNNYVFRFWDKWIIPFGSKRRVVLERFFRRNIKSSEIKSSQILNRPDVKKNRVIKKASKNSDINKFILYTNSIGNYFFNEIRDLIATGIRELGFEVDVKNENDWLCDDDAWHIVVAPHEFFYLGQHAVSENEILPENLILVNTEQPSTQWFSLAENYFPAARFIWDINYDSANRIREQGFTCKFLPLGFAADCYLFQEVKHLPENYGTCFLNKDIKEKSYLNMPFLSRPIDISFVGCITPRREEFFAKAAPVISKYRSYIFFSDGLSAPVVPGITTHMNTETVVGLMQRSKIMLNIHHGSDNYFEWHRIAILGIGQKTLVISEPSISSPIFQPGIHYVEAKLKDIPEKVEYYLSTTMGIQEAEEIIERGYKKLVEKCRLTNFLRPLILNLYNKKTFWLDPNNKNTINLNKSSIL